MNTMVQALHFHSHFREVVLHVHWKLEHLNKKHHKITKESYC